MKVLDSQQSVKEINAWLSSHACKGTSLHGRNLESIIGQKDGSEAHETIPNVGQSYPQGTAIP